MKKSILSLLLVGVLVLSVTGLGLANFRTNRDINIISREAGSGTRGAFVELLGIEVKGADGSRTDRTTIEAMVANKTDVVLASVASNDYAIGYISLGSLSDRVKAVSINGVAPSQANIINGSYKVARPFNIATKTEPTGVVKDFIEFIMSANGQAIVSDSYIAVVQDAKAFTTNKPTGKIVVAGSSSVSPLMEKLIEGYAKLNPNADIELQASDSTAGMNGAIEGTCDIGMASRALKANEIEALNGLVIAQDGIAVIVNNNNPVENLTTDQVRDIYIGEITKWTLK